MIAECKCEVLDGFTLIEYDIVVGKEYVLA